MQEAQFTDLDKVRSRAIADSKSKLHPMTTKNRKLASDKTPIMQDLYKVVIGAMSYNITIITKMLLDKSNRTYPNKLHFIQAMTGSEVKKLISLMTDKEKASYISTDASKCDSTRNKYLRKLDIAAFEFYLKDLMEVME